VLPVLPVLQIHSILGARLHPNMIRSQARPIGIQRTREEGVVT
jgi:hypothetical protein